MGKTILFFSAGFAFNRLIRLRYYEKIFPKDTKIILCTTDKYGSKEEEAKKWALKRTKIIVLHYSPLKNLIEIRRLCKEFNVDILTNLGVPFGLYPLIFANFFRNKKLLLYVLGDSIDYSKLDMLTKSGIKNLLSLIPYFIIEKFASKTAFVGRNSFNKAPLFFLSPKRKFFYLHAPVNTEIFKPVKKEIARKSLNITPNQKLIVYVGRITKRKGCILLREVIKSNPEIKFILIGKWLENEIPKFEFKNMEVIEKVDNKDLSKYYSAADLVFGYHRQGCQMGIVGEESLACGTPIIHTKRVCAPDKQFIIKVKDSVEDIKNKINDFFKLSKTDRIALSKESREFAITNLSDEVWKEKYIDFYLAD